MDELWRNGLAGVHSRAVAPPRLTPPLAGHAAPAVRPARRSAPRCAAFACSLGLVLAVLSTSAPSAAQEVVEVTPEYRLKAEFIHNFIKFIEWPDGAGGGPLTICVAGQNPFGSTLTSQVEGDTVSGRPIALRVILEPEDGCHVVFVPRTSLGPQAYLRQAQGTPTLTVGEAPDFVTQGGIIGFSMEAERVRFTIDQAAAEKAGLKISSRLLTLARQPE